MFSASIAGGGILFAGSTAAQPIVAGQNLPDDACFAHGRDGIPLRTLWCFPALGAVKHQQLLLSQLLLFWSWATSAGWALRAKRSYTAAVYTAVGWLHRCAAQRPVHCLLVSRPLCWVECSRVRFKPKSYCSLSPHSIGVSVGAGAPPCWTKKPVKQCRSRWGGPLLSPLLIHTLRKPR